MLKALRFSGWPLLAGVLVALLIIQRYPEWVGLPSLDVNLQQAPANQSPCSRDPVSYADPRDHRPHRAVVNLVHHQGHQQTQPSAVRRPAVPAFLR